MSDNISGVIYSSYQTELNRIRNLWLWVRHNNDIKEHHQIEQAIKGYMMASDRLIQALQARVMQQATELYQINIARKMIN
jgi:hypothetical protein